MIALIDYGAGNLRSVANALEHLEVEFEVVTDPEGLARAERVVFPGVGAATSCMEALESAGLDEALRACEAPVLGICLGMQVFTSWSAEGVGRVECLGVLPGHTALFEGAVKRPQIGWNTVRPIAEDPLFEGIPPDEHFYFAHSYRVHTEPECVLAETDHGGPYPSAVRRANFRGVQFHPEKSGLYGLRLLENFARRC